MSATILPWALRVNICIKIRLPGLLHLRIKCIKCVHCNFRVASDTGIVTLKPGVPEMTFTFAVDVEDRAGIKARSMVAVTVQYISDDAVYSSGSLRLYGK